MHRCLNRSTGRQSWASGVSRSAAPRTQMETPASVLRSDSCDVLYISISVLCDTKAVQTRCYRGGRMHHCCIRPDVQREQTQRERAAATGQVRMRQVQCYLRVRVHIRTLCAGETPNTMPARRLVRTRVLRTVTMARPAHASCSRPGEALLPCAVPRHHCAHEHRACDRSRRPLHTTRTRT